MPYTQYHGGVRSDHPRADQRLALLLAGGGVRVRRLLAGEPPTVLPFDVLRARGSKTATENGRRLVEHEVPVVYERISTLEHT